LLVLLLLVVRERQRREQEQQQQQQELLQPPLSQVLRALEHLKLLVLELLPLLLQGR
jgi:hypothetical protein